MLTEDAHSLHTCAQTAAPFSSRRTALTYFDSKCCQQVDCSFRDCFSVFVSKTLQIQPLKQCNFERFFSFHKKAEAEMWQQIC